ncbi:MAG: group I intron-associated PD-(D/E)XK endonuclease [Terriglobales bacterium]
MSISHEELLNQPLSKIVLKTKPRGELAELAFMRKAASLGFAVAKPWGDCDRYDVIVRSGKNLWRVQVKSVAALNPYRNHYRIGVVDRWRFPYTAEQIDFLVGYVFPEDAWYIFPVAVTESHKIVCVRPGLKGAKYEEYREAWELMRTGPTKLRPTV